MDQNHEETNEISCYDYHVSFSPEEVARKERSITSQGKIRGVQIGKESAYFTKTNRAASFIRTQLMLGASRH